MIKIPKGQYLRNKKHRKILSDNAKKRYIKNPEIKDAVLKRDHYHCQMCREKFSPDHLVLYYLTSKGNPTTEIENILTLCKECEIIAYKGSIQGYDKNDKPMIDRWNKEDIFNMRLCRKFINNHLDR